MYEYRVKTIYERNYKRCTLFSRATSVLFQIQVRSECGWAEIGHVRTILYDEKHWETHSSIDVFYRRRGLGVGAYDKAIEFFLERGHSISSSIEPSHAAMRVWESGRLNACYVIKKRRSRYCVLGRKKGARPHV